MSQVKFNSVDPDNIFTEEDEDVITKQIINKDMIMSFIIDVKEFSIKCQTDELDFDSISKEVNLFENVLARFLLQRLMKVLQSRHLQ